MSKHSIVIIFLFCYITNSYAQPNRQEDTPTQINVISLQKEDALRAIIEAQKQKYYHDEGIIKKFDVVFEILDSIQKRRTIPNQDLVLQAKWDSLVKKFGNPFDVKLLKRPDFGYISTDQLKSDLDFAFRVRAEKEWLAKMPDSLFLEYILPYRVGTERYEPEWRRHLYESYNNAIKKGNGKQESFEKIKNTDLLGFANEVQYDIRKKISTNATMWSYPFDMPISKMEKGMQGACRHLVNYTTAAMRSVGIPVTSDFTLLWGNSRTGHKWNVLFKSDGTPFPFEACSYPMSLDLRDRKVAKIFRETFFPSRNTISPNVADVPNYLYDSFWQDVSSQYIKCFDIKLNVPKDIANKKEFVLIGTFDNAGWKPQFFAEEKNGGALFKNMGSENVYIGMYLENNILKTFGAPFKLDSLGEITFLAPTKNIGDMTVKRKYHRTSWVDSFEKSMVGGRFEASNDVNFEKKLTLFTIEDVPDSFVEREISSDSKFRYLRYVAPNVEKAFIGEIGFYTEGNQPVFSTILNSTKNPSLNKITDGDLNTYYWGKSQESIVFDLDEGFNITKIQFAPRSDTNFIVVGDNYELFTWENNEWVSCGEKTADRSELTFQKVPQNSLYLLRNLSGGTEERIFTYENGKQVWW